MDLFKILFVATVKTIPALGLAAALFWLGCSALKNGKVWGFRSARYKTEEPNTFYFQVGLYLAGALFFLCFAARFILLQVLP